VDDYLNRLNEIAKQNGATPEAGWREDLMRTYQGAGGEGGRSMEDVFQSIASNQQSRGSGGNGGGGNDAVSAWTGSNAPQVPDYASQIIQEMRARQAAQDAENKARADALFSRLTARADQGLGVDRNDPQVRLQADAFAANTERARRDFVSDLAEREGPLANLRGEERLASERAGQATGAFEAELIGREIRAEREEISTALAQMGHLLSGDQARALQERLSLLDNALAEQGLALQGRGLDQDWRRALLNNDQFYADLGLRAEDRASHWDAVRRGIY
jgi:hypothetical protein